MGSPSSISFSMKFSLHSAAKGFVTLIDVDISPLFQLLTVTDLF